MATSQCIGCGRQVSRQSIACPDCGSPVGYSGGTSIQRDASPRPEAFAKSDEGALLLESNDYEGAIDLFTEAIALKPDFVDAYRLRAEAYKNLGRHEDADSDLKTLAGFNPVSQRQAEEGRTREQAARRMRARQTRDQRTGPAPPQSYRRSESATAPDEGFFESLFDMSFTAFVTTRIVKVLYFLLILVAGLGSVFLIISGFSASQGVGFLILFIVAPLFFLITVIYARVILELIIVVFRIAEHAAEIAEQGRRAAQRPPSGEE